MSDDEVRCALAELVLHLDNWAYDLFPEGDYSKKWSDLKKWSKKILSEYEQIEEED